MQLTNSIAQLRRAALGGIILAFAASAAFAQAPVHYLGLTFLKTLPGKADAFRKFAETDAAKLGRAGVDDGTLDAFYLMRLTAPYATGSDYDYVQAVWYKNRPSLAATPTSTWEARAKKAGLNYADFVATRDTLAKSVRSAWRTSVLHVGDLKAGNYVRTANYQVEPDYRADLLRFFEEYSMPLAKNRMTGGGLQGWGVTRPAAATMSDDEAGFSFSVSNVLKDSDTLMAGPGALNEDVLKKAVPGKTFANYETELHRLAAHYKIVTTRISEVVVFIGALPAVTP